MMMELKREHWTQQDYLMLVEYLKSLSDEKYKKFSDGLVPDGIPSLGVRIPLLRRAAKEISRGCCGEFLECKKGVCREEIILEGLVMSLIKCGYPQMLSYVKRYAGMIRSWETCDTVSFKGLKKYLPEFWEDIGYFIYSENPWIVRYGLGCLMEFYLTDEYIDRVLEYTASVSSDFYYVQMMQAWLVASAAAKQRDKAFAFLADNRLSPEAQNMAVRKIRDSYRISPQDKELAKGLVRRN